MEKINFAVSFQLKKNKKASDGKYPIYLRITVDGKRFEKATGKYVDDKQWDNKTNRTKGKSEFNQIINQYLMRLENQVNEHYLKIIGEERIISIDDFKARFQEGKTLKYTLVQAFENNNKLMKRSLGNKYSESTYSQYLTTFSRLKQFLEKEYSISDIELKKLDISFIARFDVFLRKEFEIKDNTIAKHLKQLKKVVHDAIRLRYLKFDPFDSYKINYTEADRGFLTVEELNRIEEKSFKIKRLEEVKDVFVFVCYTGLSYSDLKSLTNVNIIKGIDGKNWIKFERKKTGVPSSIPILQPAQDILNKYAENIECIAYEKLLPVKSNQKLNSYLSELAELCEINKHVTMHLARHTFATTVTLENVFP